VAEYLLYHFRGAELVECDRFHAPNDSEAIEGALTRLDGTNGELWHGRRRVKEFAADEVDQPGGSHPNAVVGEP
jgi:hypothetical protein